MAIATSPELQLRTAHSLVREAGGQLYAVTMSILWMAAATSAVQAQAARQRPRPVPRTAESSYEAQMKSDLRNLVTAQESYFADQVTYTSALSALRFTPSAGVTVTVPVARGMGWNAVARHERSTTACGVFVGRAQPPVRGAREGEPRCGAIDSAALVPPEPPQPDLATPTPARFDTSTAGLAPSERAYLPLMKSHLRNLVTVQEQYFLAHATYSADLRDLHFTPSNGVSVEFTSVSNSGWSASARHASTPLTCVIFVGGAPPPFGLAYEAEPKCGRVGGTSSGTSEAQPGRGGLRNLAKLPSRYSGSIARGESLRFSITLTASTDGCNASTGMCSIIVNASGTVPFSISLHNARGQLVDRGRVHGSGGSHDAEIAPHIPVGSYELVVTGLARGWITVSWS